jgi:hypothetical protein
VKFDLFGAVVFDRRFIRRSFIGLGTVVRTRAHNLLKGGSVKDFTRERER